MAYALNYSRRLEMIVRISQLVGLWGSLTSLHPGAILVAVHGAMVACHCVRRHQRDVDVQIGGDGMILIYLLFERYYSRNMSS